MKRQRRILMTAVLGSLAFTLISGQIAIGSIATSTAGFGSTTVVDFSQFTGGFVFGGSPQQVGGLVSEDILWSPEARNPGIGNGTVGFGGSSSWDSTRSGYVVLPGGTQSHSMRFDFLDGPVVAVGGFVNHGGGSSFVLEALDINGDVLESFYVSNLAPVSTPDSGNDGAFRGIIRETADIHALRISGHLGALDDLTFSRSVGTGVVPEATSLLTWGILALVGGVGIGRRWRR